MSNSYDVQAAIADGLKERLKDPIIGTFAVSFLIFNWDLVVILLNYKGDFHANIHYIKSALSPTAFEKPLSIGHFFGSVLKGWHTLRFIIPGLITYFWLFHWPNWTRSLFRKIQGHRIDREKIVTDLKEESLALREKLISAKEENISLKEKTSELTNQADKNLLIDFEGLWTKGLLDIFVMMANSKNDANYLNNPVINEKAQIYANLGLIHLTTIQGRISSISLTDKGQFFYTQAIKKVGFESKFKS